MAGRVSASHRQLDEQSEEVKEMRIIVALDISTKEIERLTGASKSKVYRMMRNGKDTGKVWENLGKAINAKVLSVSVLPNENGKDLGKTWENRGKAKRKERENEEREETKDFFPQTPFIENKKEKKEKDKEKENFFPPKPPEGRREKAEAEERSGGVRREIFYAPTIGEVQSYIDLKGYLTDAEEFVAFYESKGWMVGKNKMKNWRMALVTWEKQRKRKSIENIYGNDRRDTWGKRGATPVVATSAKDYEGRF